MKPRSKTISSRVICTGIALLSLCITGHLEGQIIIVITGSAGSNQMSVTFAGTGSYTTVQGSPGGIAYNQSRVANSGHAALGGSNREALAPSAVAGPPGTQGPFNEEIEGDGTSDYGRGIFVPLESPVAFGSDTSPTNFDVIGFRINESDAGNNDSFALITDQHTSESWSSGSEISYTVGSGSTFFLDDDVSVDFDVAFNVGEYDLNTGSLVGTLRISQISAIPEPVEYAALGAAICLLTIYVRRRRIRLLSS